MSEFSYQILLFLRHIMLATTASTALFGFLYIRRFGPKSSAAEHLYYPHTVAVLAQAIAWFFLITHQAPTTTAQTVALAGALRGTIISGPIVIWIILTSGMFALWHTLSPKEFSRHLGSYYILSFIFSIFLVVTEEISLVPVEALLRIILENILAVATFGGALVLEVLFLHSWKNTSLRKELYASYRFIGRILLSGVVATVLLMTPTLSRQEVTDAWLFQQTLILIIMTSSLFLLGPALAWTEKVSKLKKQPPDDEARNAIGITVTALTVAWIAYESIPLFPALLVTYSLYLAIYLVVLLVVYLTYLLEEDMAS